MAEYRWFHAFDRASAGDILNVLRNGPKIHPDPNCSTRRHEATLGIDPNCVYAYLGRTIETFGATAIVLPIGAVEGEVSPFDTGGLVNKLEPVKAMGDSDKRTFLGAFTWPIAKIPHLLTVHPTEKRALIKRYLDGQLPPDVDGPSKLWPSKKATAAIWRSSNDWRAWTWEARSPEKFDVSRLEEWSCDTGVYDEIVDHALNTNTPFADLAARYVHGGVSNLVERWKTRQAA